MKDWRKEGKRLGAKRDEGREAGKTDDAQDTANSNLPAYRRRGKTEDGRQKTALMRSTAIVEEI
jgi:hypothetical protein